MEKEQFTIVNENEHDMIGTIERPKKLGKYPCIIFSPGLMDTSNTHYIKSFAKKFLDQGFAVITFDYTQSLGESDGRLEDTTISQRARDLKRIIEYSKRRSYINNKKIILFGHCYGAMVALYMEGFEHIVSAMILISIPSRVVNTRLTRKNDHDMMKIKLKRYFHINHVEGGEEIRLNYSFYEDGMRLDMDRAARNLKTPSLFIHGSDDKSIPPDNSEKIYGRVAGPKKFITIKMNHDIKGSALTKIFNSSIDFLKEHKLN